MVDSVTGKYHPGMELWKQLGQVEENKNCLALKFNFQGDVMKVTVQTEWAK